jgi:hypothetical protein
VPRLCRRGELKHALPLTTDMSHAAGQYGFRLDAQPWRHRSGARGIDDLLVLVASAPLQTGRATSRMRRMQLPCVVARTPRAASNDGHRRVCENEQAIGGIRCNGV